MGRLETVGDPLAAFLVLGATIWESWHARTGLDADRAEAARRERLGE